MRLATLRLFNKKTQKEQQLILSSEDRDLNKKLMNTKIKDKEQQNAKKETLNTINRQRLPLNSRFSTLSDSYIFDNTTSSGLTAITLSGDSRVTEHITKALAVIYHEKITRSNLYM